MRSAVRGLQAEIDSRRRLATDEILRTAEAYAGETRVDVQLLREVLRLLAARLASSAPDHDPRGLRTLIEKLEQAGLHHDAGVLMTARQKLLEADWGSVTEPLGTFSQLCRAPRAMQEAAAPVFVAAARAVTKRMGEIGSELGAAALLDILRGVAAFPLWTSTHARDANELIGAAIEALHPMAEQAAATQLVDVFALLNTMQPLEDATRAAAMVLLRESVPVFAREGKTLSARQVASLNGPFGRVAVDQDGRIVVGKILASLVKDERDFTEGQAAEIIGRLGALPLDPSGRKTALAFIKKWVPKLSPEMDPYAVVGVIQALSISTPKDAAGKERAKRWVAASLVSIARAPERVKKRSRLFLLKGLGAMKWPRDETIEKLIASWGTELPTERGELEDEVAAALERWGFKATRPKR